MSIAYEKGKMGLRGARSARQGEGKVKFCSGTRLRHAEKPRHQSERLDAHRARKGLPAALEAAEGRRA